jgi:dTDP-4-dehydrorhamnose reductase
MVVLVTGANGQLGHALRLVAEKHPEIQFKFYTSTDLNIVNKSSIESVFKTIKPNFCINTAAYTAVDKAESDIENARLINEIGAKNLAEVCHDFETTLIHISTDFVFDGTKKTPYTEEDIPNPKGVYGQTKRAGELEIIQHTKAYFIIRTSWLFSQFGNNFMKTMLRLAAERKIVSIVNDQIGTPTHAVDLAEAIVKVINSKSSKYGIYNFSNEGSASWFDFAHKIVEYSGLDVNVIPIKTSEYPTPAQRPHYSVLDKSKIKIEFHLHINSWEKALEESIKK